MSGAFSHKIPPQDLEPVLTDAWRAAQRLSIGEREELEPILRGLIETKCKIEWAIAVATGKDPA